VPHLDTPLRGTCPPRGQIYGTRPNMACSIFLYYIYRNEQNYSISSNNKIDQSLKKALNKLTSYVEKSLMKNKQ